MITAQRSYLLAALWTVTGLVGTLSAGQDFSVLRINEVIADNGTQGPADAGGGRPDIIEIYNGGDVAITLSGETPEDSVALSDTWTIPTDLEAAGSLWAFRNGHSTGVGNFSIRAGETLLVYCDGDVCQNECEPHASFQIDSDGNEPITLWGPESEDGVRPIIDRVWLPPLRRDVSFGRFPHGAGPAIVPIEETFEHFRFFSPGTSTFSRSCIPTGSPCCAGELNVRLCEGDENDKESENLEPRVSRNSHSTNAPTAGEGLTITVEVRDDQLPVPPNIASVQIVYRVDQGAEQVVEMSYDVDSGVLPNIPVGSEPGDEDFPDSPLDRFTLWVGTIPPQVAGSQVQFIYRVEDKSAENNSSTRPRNLCDFNVGPCDRDFGGHGGCEKDLLSTSCRIPNTEPPEYELHGVRYFECSAWFSYAVGYETRSDIRGLVINEIMAVQSMTEQDPSSMPSSEYCTSEGGAPDYCCIPRDDVPPPADCGFEDFIELYNSSENTVDLSGLWLSDRWFQPRGWQFPDGSELAAGEYAIVWLDGDGGRCPEDLPADERPCFFDCPDPTDPAAGRYHASFQIDGGGDQIFIFDSEENGYGLIHGADFGDQEPDISLSLCPNGDASGDFVLTADVTFRGPTPEGTDCPPMFEPQFKRGDASNDCGIDLSDAVFILNWLFLGGQTPACQDAADSNDSGGVDLSDAVYVLNWLFLGGPEPTEPGPNLGTDPTEDNLPECMAKDCS